MLFKEATVKLCLAVVHRNSSLDENRTNITQYLPFRCYHTRTAVRRSTNCCTCNMVTRHTTHIHIYTLYILCAMSTHARSGPHKVHSSLLSECCCTLYVRTWSTHTTHTHIHHDHTWVVYVAVSSSGQHQQHRWRKQMKKN